MDYVHLTRLIGLESPLSDSYGYSPLSPVSKSNWKISVEFIPTVGLCQRVGRCASIHS